MMWAIAATSGGIGFGLGILATAYWMLWQIKRTEQARK